MPMTFSLHVRRRPRPAWTPAVLDALARAGVRATFFVLGERRPRATGAARARAGRGPRRAAARPRAPAPPRPDRAEVAADIDAALASCTASASALLWRAPLGRSAPAQPAPSRTSAGCGSRAGRRHARLDGAAAGDDARRGRPRARRRRDRADARRGRRRARCASDCGETAPLIGPLVARRPRGAGSSPARSTRCAHLPAGNPELVRA